MTTTSMLAIVTSAVGSVIAAIAARRSAVRDRLDILYNVALTRRDRVRSQRFAACDRALFAADLPMTFGDAMKYLVIGMVAIAAVLTALDPLLAVLAVAVLAIVAPVVVFARRNRRARKLQHELPNLLRSIASELRSGGTVVTAITAIAGDRQALSHECTGLVARVGVGASIEEALLQWSEGDGSDGVRATAGALSLASSVGGPSADALDGLAESLAHRIAINEETRAQSAQARASALVMVLAPLGYLVFASSIDQRALSVLMGTTVGRLCMLIGIGLDALAVVWIRFLVRDRFAS